MRDHRELSDDAAVDEVEFEDKFREPNTLSTRTLKLSSMTMMVKEIGFPRISSSTITQHFLHFTISSVLRPLTPFTKKENSAEVATNDGAVESLETKKVDSEIENDAKGVASEFGTDEDHEHLASNAPGGPQLGY